MNRLARPPDWRRLPLALPVLLLALGTGWAGAGQAVALSGMIGNKALLVVDGSAPKVVGAGESFRGVKVLSTQGQQATIELDGKRQTLHVGQSPVSIGGSGRPEGNKIVLNAGTGGHFIGNGSINGSAMQFMVDTGATSVAVGINQARSIAGLDLEKAQKIRVGTANGTGQAWRVSFRSVRVGEVELYDVDGVVTSTPMPYVLLGNTFLSRFQMERTNDTMVLMRRY